MRAAALSRKRGVAFTAFPPPAPPCPPLATPCSLGAQADIPGAYADTLTISEAVVKGSVFSVTTAAHTLRARGALQAIGNPLLIAPGTTGLQSAAAATPPLQPNGFTAGPPSPGHAGEHAELWGPPRKLCAPGARGDHNEHGRHGGGVGVPPHATQGAPRGPGCHCTGPGGEQSPVGGAVENEGSVRSFKKASAATPFSPRTAAET